jgi:hypothetical protein
MQPVAGSLRRWRSRGALIALVIGVLVVVAACSIALVLRTQSAYNDLKANLDAFTAIGQTGETLTELTGAEALAAANRLPGVRVPPNATEIHFGREGQVKPVFWLRFAIPPDSLSQFSAANCLDSLEAGYNPAFEYGTTPDLVANLDWWQPSAARRFAGAECSPQANVTFHLLADQSDASSWIVYLEIVTK